LPEMLSDEGPPQPGHAVVPERLGRPTRWTQAGVFLTVLFAYLVGESRTPPYIDSRQIYDVAESIVYRRSIEIPVPNGTAYAPHPFLPSAIHVPGAMVRWALARNNPSLDRIIKPITSHLGSQVMVAIGCLVFFRLLVYLGVSLAGASIGTFVLAFATFLPIYARTAWSEGCQTSCFMGFFSSLLRLRDRPGRKTGLWFGLWTGLLVNSKYVFVLALPGASLFLVYHAWRDRKVRALLVAAAWSIPSGAVFLAVVIWYNWARTGAATSTGYAPLAGLAASVFREDLLFGLWSQFFSLGKGIFFYSPPLVFAVLALPFIARNRAACLWCLVLTAGPVLCLYGKFVYWSGDWCWGPRYLLFLVPVLLLLAVLRLDQSLRRHKKLLLAAWCGVSLLGLWVQLAGASQYWDHFIRVSKTVQTRWLGNPNRQNAYVAEVRGQCDPCFEDFYARTYTPAFQPIEAQGWYLRHHLHSDPWEVAVLDMPLRRYTAMDFDVVRQWYQHPNWDWWKLGFVAAYARSGAILMAIFVLGFFTGVAVWLRGLYLERKHFRSFQALYP